MEILIQWYINKISISFSTGISAIKNELVVLDLERIENEKVKMKPIKRFS